MPLRPHPGTGGLSHLAATQHGRETDPADPSAVTPPARSFPRRATVLAAVSVVTVLAVSAVSVVSGRNAPPNATTPEAKAAVPATGPFTGTFTADVGPLLDASGNPVAGADPPYRDTWRLRSVCPPSGCIATAATSGRLLGATDLVFDDVGGAWLAVVSSQDKCGNVSGERFDVVWLQPRPDGTMAGERIAENAQGCYGTRAVTVTRIGDTDVAALPDPAGQPPRVASPAQALHGRYHTELDHSSGVTEQFNFSVRTFCLRTGVRCMSIFRDPPFIQPYVFSDGTWTRSSEFVTTCPADGRTSGTRLSARLPLPQPAQDPIGQLTGHGRQEPAGTDCPSSDFDQRMVRTGD